jgi:hypothetical protein
MALPQKPLPIHSLGFAPDLPTNTQPLIIVDSNGMYPTMSGVRMMPSLVQASSPLPGVPFGAYLSKLPTGGVNIFAGTTDHLWRMNSPIGGVAASWADADGTQTFNTSYWSFAQVGYDCVATDGNDAVQVYGSTASAFTPLGGSPPRAKFVIAVDPGAGRGVVTMLANLVTDATGWVSSAPGNDAIWTLNVNDLSASGFLQSAPGAITGLATLRTYATAFKEHALYIGAFVGPPFVWDWQPVSHQVGTLSNDGIVNALDVLYFVGPDDFYSFDGSNVTAIPNGLKQWFFGTPGAPGTGYAHPSFLNKIQGRYDSTAGVIYWHFVSVNSAPSGQLDTYVSFNRRVNRWNVGHLNITNVLHDQYISSGTTYDQFASRYHQYQNLPHETYGSNLFAPATGVQQALFLPNNALYTYSGAPSSGYVQLGDLGDPGGLTRVNNLFGMFGIYPAVNPATGNRGTVNTFSRPILGSPLTPRLTNIALGIRSDYSVRQTDYWHQFQFMFTNDAELQAIQADIVEAGDR